MGQTTGALARNNSALSAEETTWLLDQRLKGYTVRQISAMCPEGIGRPLSPSQVHKRIEKELTRRKEPTLEAVRKMELDRLDDLEQRIRDRLEKHPNTESYQAATTLLKIGERRSKLKGLDAPVQVVQETKVEYTIVGVNPEALK